MLVVNRKTFQIINFWTEGNIRYLLDIAIAEMPSKMDHTVYYKVATFIAILYSKNTADTKDVEFKYDFEFVCLKLCLLLLDISSKQNDDKVLLIYVNRAGFLSGVLTATNCADDNVACTSIQLLTCIIYHFTKNNYKPNSILELPTDQIVKSLRQDGENERGSSLLELVHVLLSSGRNTPVVLGYELKEHPSQMQQCNALRALMFRIQMMLCCQDPNNQSSDGWKTLNAMLNHAIVSKNDMNEVATLTSQPWTHTLIRFQLTQNVTQEFLAYVHNWLILLKITIKKGKETTNYHISKYSLIGKTLKMLKNNLNEDDSNKNVLRIVNEIKEL